MSAPAATLVPLRIRLPYSAESEFVARYGSNVSRGGIFIATRSLKSEGTPLAFELLLKTGVVLLRGEAVVAKTQVDSGGGRSGMTLRFVRLDGPSRAVVERVLAERGAGHGRGPLGPSVVQRPGRSELSKRIDAALAAEERTSPEGDSGASPESSPEARRERTIDATDGLSEDAGRSQAHASDVESGEAGASTRDAAEESTAEEQGALAAEEQAAFAADAQAAVATDEQSALAADAPTTFEADAQSADAQTAFSADAQTAFSADAQTTFETDAQAAFAADEQAAVATDEQSALAADAQTTFEADAQTTFEADAQTTFETDAQSALAADAQTTFEADAQATFSADARTTLEADAQKTFEADEQAAFETDAQTTFEAGEQAVFATDAQSSFAADAQAALATDAQVAIAGAPQPLAAGEEAASGMDAQTASATAAPQVAAEPPPLATQSLEATESDTVASPDAEDASTSDPEPIALTIDEVIPLSLEDEALPDAGSASGLEPASATDGPSAPASEAAAEAIPDERPGEHEPSAPSLVSAPAETSPPDESASSTGIAAPLELPSLPERPATLLEPVLGIELVGAVARVGVWSGGVTSQLALAPDGSFPMLACLQGDRWQLGRGAVGREGAQALFAPPIDPLPRARNGLGERLLTFGERDIPARTIGANLFALLRAEIEEALGRPVRDVMFVVPSWFSYRDRLLLAESAQLGGLRALQILHATSAACASFAQERGLARKRVLVLHAEPAHFEAAIIQVTGDDLEVISTQGALPLGEAVGLDQLVDVTRAVLTAAGASIESLDEVVRFGDPTALARAAPPLAELLGRPLPEPLDDAAAVRGAALLGHAHTELARGRHGGCAFEVLVSPLSLVQRDGTLRRVLEVGTRLPAEKALNVPLAASELLALIFCDGPGARIEEADVIGAANVESGPMGGELSVRVTVDRNGQLGLSTSLSGGKAEVRPLTREFDPGAMLPLTLPAQPARKSGFLRGFVQKLGKS